MWLQCGILEIIMDFLIRLLFAAIVLVGEEAICDVWLPDFRKSGKRNIRRLRSAVGHPEE
jgi:hypothetical protein